MTEENIRPLSPEEIAEIAALEAKATPEPWTAEWGYAGAERTLFLNRGEQFDGVLFGRSYDAAEKAQHESDTIFAAHSRQAVPRLLATIQERDATIDAKEAENAELRRELATKDALIGQPAPDVQTYSTSSWPPNPCRNGHDKCSNDVLMALPGRYLWICRRCGMEGLDIKHHAELGEYERLQQRKVAPQGEEEKP